MSTSSVHSAPDLWAAMASFGPVLKQVQERGVQVPDTYGSPLYLGQYLSIHTAIDAEVHRLQAAGVTAPLVVDWGAGVGHCAFVRHALGDRVTAHALSDLEASPYFPVLRQVSEITGIEIRPTEDPVALPFDDGEVDVLVSCGVLEHVHEGGGSVDQSLTEIKRVLSPGGAFVCGHLPSSGSWVEWFNRKTGRSHHDRTFKRDETVVLGQRQGFELVAIPRKYGVVPRIQIANRLQRRGRDTVGAGQKFEKFDRVALKLGASVAQNYLLVLRKPMMD